MKTVIKLNEAEIRKAVHEYVENNTRFLEDNNAKSIRIEREEETGEYVAVLEVDEDLDTEIPS
jgi:hypothetical protein